MPIPPTELIVYDLDGVITTRDSFTALIIAQLRRQPFRLVRALPAALTMLLSRSEDRRHSAARRVTQIALAHVTEAGYAELAETFGARIGQDPSWIRTAAVDRVRAQHAHGARIVIATATEHQLARALLEQAGVPYDVLLASQLASTATGIEFSDHRVAARKVAALREQGIAIETAEFVTDSLTDLPAARAAARVVLIGASANTRVRFEQAAVTVTIA
jgi:phosphatidylglycerophosphatase C